MPVTTPLYLMGSALGLKILRKSYKKSNNAYFA